MDIRDRLREARLKRGYRSAAKAAEAIGVPYGTYSGHENGSRGIRRQDIIRYSRFFGVSPAWLEFGTTNQVEEPPLPVTQVHVRGNVQAGIWAEFEEFPDAVGETIPTVPGRYAALEQWAYRVGGTSMNKVRLFDGDYVICVPYFMARTAVTSDDLAVVERRNGGKTERTVKQIEIDQYGVCRLWPRSDDPRFQAPIPCDGPEPDGTEIEIVGLVIGSFTPR